MHYSVMNIDLSITSKNCSLKHDQYQCKEEQASETQNYRQLPRQGAIKNWVTP